MKFNPEKDIPDLAGKVILVTGGTTGIGAETVIALAKHNPTKIYFTGRNESSAKSVISSIQETTPTAPVEFLPCDLSSLTSVQDAAKKILATESRLDILICNAGIMAVPPSQTKEGYEIQFGTNHVGHALLIKLLLPLLDKTQQDGDKDVRIVILTSQGYGLHPKGGILFSRLKTPLDDLGVIGGWTRYGQSKLANLLYARELARHYPNITATSIHPGVVGTNLVSKQGFWNKALIYASQMGKVKTPAEGAWNQLWAATGKKSDVEVNGGYYEPVGVLTKLSKQAASDKLAGELWEWTEKELEGWKIEEDGKTKL